MQPFSIRLFLVRHAQAIANVDMRYVGSRDDPLTEYGLWQITCLERAFASIPVVAIYSSPLRRANDTAIAIARACDLPVQVDPRLREGAFGEWEGMTHAEVRGRSAHDADLVARWGSDPQCAPPGGESFHDIQIRALDLVQELARLHTGSNVVLVSHVSPIKALLCAALEVTLPTARHLFLDPATISVVDWGPQPLIRLFNAHEHLGWDAARWMVQQK